MIALVRLRHLLKPMLTIVFGLAASGLVLGGDGAVLPQVDRRHSAQNGPASLLPVPKPRSAPFRSDRILVKPKAKVDPATMARLHARLNARVLRSFPAIGNLQILQLPPGANPGDFITAYRQSGSVEYAELDYLVQALLTPDDFRYWDGTLWNLHNTGLLGGLPGADIHAAEGWDLQNTAGNIVVAVIDSGIRHTHEDLSANMWTNPGETGLDGSGADKSTNSVDDDGDGYVDDVYGIDAVLGTGNPVDTVGHGTHVSGIIGAVGNNSVGVVGVAWQVRMMDCKFLNAVGQGAGSISDAITCIDYARSKGARIINASWGGYSFTSTALYDAVSSTRDAGMLFVAATGNDGNDNDVTPLYPASYDLDNIIAVMATTRADTPASWSNFGARGVDIGAPGQDIFSCWNDADDSYQAISGTSMAAAHVSGVCALVWAHYPNESYQRIIRRVLNSADTLASLAGKCVTGGRLDLYTALSSPLRPRLSITQSSSQLHLLLQGEPSTSYVLEASLNLSLWSPVQTNQTALNGEFTFVQTNPGTLRGRFFRARISP